jgi:putative ABC transport system permease protein
MLKNYIAAALRNLVRNRAYAAINLLGLALGYTAAILIALYVRDEFTFDQSFPNADRIYQIGEFIEPPGSPPIRTSVTAAYIAPTLQLDFPEIDLVTRLVPASVTVRRKGGENATPAAYWADPTFFQMFPMKAIAGELTGALSRPDDIVLTHRAAQQFFGRDDVVGETLEINQEHPLRVAAVVADLPSNSNLGFDILLPAIAGFSATAALDAVPPSDMVQNESVHGYLRLRSGASIDVVRSRLRAFTDHHVAGEINGFKNSKAYTFVLTPLPAVHFIPPRIGDLKPPADPGIVRTLVGIAILILCVAGGNFVSMMTARAARRAVEVGVRKSVGATQRQVMLQFLGESIFYSILAFAVAAIAVMILLPSFNAFLQRDIALHFASAPTLTILAIGIAVCTGLLAGSYPALVLSRFHPGEVLKGQIFRTVGRDRVRHALVIFQFATLIALVIITGTVHRQSQFAIDDRLRLPSDQIYLGGMSLACPEGFLDSVKRLAGVRAATCTSDSSLTFGRVSATFPTPSGGLVATRSAPLGYEFFNVFGVKPLAGRLLSPAHAEDDVLAAAGATTSANPSLVINESASRALGYKTPAAAVGQFRSWGRLQFGGKEIKIVGPLSSEIVGVVPDFSIGSVRDVIEPTVYYVDPAQSYWLVLKLDGRTIPETLNSLKDLWAKYDTIRPLGGVFLSQYLNDLYADIQRQSTIFSAFAGVAIAIAALGLLGLAISTAERRTKEIGLRKVLGAKRLDILQFLAWQFARPVLWANLLAWPCAYFVLQRWLEGFAYHIDQSPLFFIVAGALALVIAFVTVVGHAVVVARAKPVDALRYE